MKPLEAPFCDLSCSSRLAICPVSGIRPSSDLSCGLLRIPPDPHSAVHRLAPPSARLRCLACALGFNRCDLSEVSLLCLTWAFGHYILASGQRALAPSPQISAPSALTPCNRSIRSRASVLNLAIPGAQRPNLLLTARDLRPASAC